MNDRYFHGGVPGLRPGDELTPQSDPGWHRDDCAWCQSHADDARHPDRIYVTTDREYARFYASRYGRGDLYVVEPMGELVMSDEDPFPTWKAERARVRTVYERAIALTHQQRRRLWKRWPDKGGLPLGATYDDLVAFAARMAEKPQ